MTDKFTLYDLFASLIPGVVFLVLLSATLRLAAGIQLVDWAGGFGDATLLVIIGYAVGSLLQAVGNTLIEPLWHGYHGGQPTAAALLPRPKRESMRNALSEGLRQEALKALSERYGPLGDASDIKAYTKGLEEKTYRAYMDIVEDSAKVRRFVAEHHAMRAYGVAFFLLLCVTAVLVFFINPAWSRVQIALLALYPVLTVLALRRMNEISITLVSNILNCFLTSMKEKKTDAVREDT